jgi:DNA-binding CsgD family transcriptional regulator
MPSVPREGRGSPGAADLTVRGYTAAHERALDADTESLHSMLAQAQAQVAQLTAQGKAAKARADTAEAAEADLRRQLADLQRRAERHQDETRANTDRVRLAILAVLCRYARHNT